MQRGPPEPGGRSRSLPVGRARSLLRLGWSAALAGPGGSGNSRTQAPPPAHFDGKTPNTSVKVAPWPQRASGGRGSLLTPARLCHACPAAFLRSRPAEPRGARCPGRQRPYGEGHACSVLSCPAAACPCPAPLPAAPQHLDNKSCRRAEWAGLGPAPPAHTPPEPIDVQMPMGPGGWSLGEHTPPSPTLPAAPGAGCKLQPAGGIADEWPHPPPVAGGWPAHWRSS